MDVELQATCSSLGFLEGNEYIKEPDCLETVKDLIRFLRRDSDVCDIRRQLGHAQILQNDLIPLVKFYHKDKILFDTVMKLMVNLTQPVITCFNNEIPDEKTLRNYCLEVEGYLQDYKEAFINEDFFNILAEKIQDILKLDCKERREEDKLQLERLFVLIRNVLMVPSNSEREQRTEDDASTHDQILWIMHTSGVEDLILYIASSDKERSMLCMHILEIIFLMFKEQRVGTGQGKERAQKKASILKFSARHSRFGGTYIIKNMKSISENDVIYHKPLCEMETFSSDAGKIQKKRPKNRAPIKSDSSKRRSTLSMRLSLKEFCVQFLVNAYNPLMRAVKDALSRKSTQDNDETYYLWTLRFFMQFCRLHFKRVDLISETMSLAAFHYIYTQLCTYYENIRLEKGEQCKIWGKRAHLALKAYQELLYTLDAMCRSTDDKIKGSAQVIQSNVFYMVEYRDVFVTLLKNFQESKCSRDFLKDLVESSHTFLKMLEGFMKSNRHLVVQKKKKNKRKSKKENTTKGNSGPGEEELAADWTEHISSQLSTLLQNQSETITTVTPFDAASDMDMDEQRIEAMMKIQLYLREKNLDQAVSLFRSAREVWPERDEFGSENMVVDEELIALQEIFMAANLQRPQSPSQHNNQEEDDDDVVNEIEEEEREETLAHESEFDFKSFINDFAHQNLIKNYVILLQEFSTNSDNVNHCVVKMLHRISHDLGYVGMLFQASVFRAFNCLLQGQYTGLQRYQELTRFACYVVRQFTNIATINKKIFVDLLFWKTRNEALAITDGYDFNKKSKVKALWTEHEEQELQSLYEKYRDVVHPELDLVELIQGELTSSHTRLQILKELRRQGLITGVKDIKKKGTRQPKWTEDELQKLKDAFDIHSNSDYPINEIMKTLNTDKSKRVVIAKIIDLGLVHDKKQLLKQKSSRGKRNGRNQDSSDEEEERVFSETNLRREHNRTTEQQDNDSGDDGDDDDDNGWQEGESAEEDGGDSNLMVAQSTTTINEYVASLIEKGYNRQLLWIIRGLRNAAEDREDGVCVPTPLVPLTEENEIAMEDEIFLMFLRSIGITPPVSEQEMFWRIPANYSASDLSKICDYLELSVSGQAAVADDINEIVSRVLPRSSSVQPAGGTNLVRKKTKRGITGDHVRTSQKPKSRKKPVQKLMLKDRNSNSNSPSHDLSSIVSDEDDSKRNVSVIAKRRKDSDTSDSGLDPEIELKEQERIRAEKMVTNNKNSKAKERRHALMQMIEMKKSKKNTTTSKEKRQETKQSVTTNLKHHTDSSVIDDDDDDGLEFFNSQQDESETNISGLSPTKERLNDASDPDKSPRMSQPASASAKKRMLESDSDNDSQFNTRQESDHTKKRFRLLSSDEDSDNNNAVLDEISSSGNVMHTELNESLKLHLSDSETPSDIECDVPKKVKGTIDIDQEIALKKQTADSFPATLLTQVLDSDDEDDHIPLRAAVKKRKAIIDDDEDE